MPERRSHDIRAGVIAAVLAGLVLVVIAAVGVVHGLTKWWEIPLAGPNATAAMHVPEPQLESAPQEDRARYVAGKQGVLERYEWIDREKGIARIPIEEAMRLVARGSAAIDKAPIQAHPHPNLPPEGEGEFVPSPSGGGSQTQSANLVQRLGDTLPLNTVLIDERGRESPLSTYFGGVPVVLVFGYYRCPTLCTTLMDGVLLALSASGLSPASYRVVGVSIDPREHAADAAAKASAYRQAYGSIPISLLTGTEIATRELARAAGVTYAWDARYGQSSHPLAFAVVTPQGRIARYFPGVRFEPRDLRLALVEASEARIGSLSERIFLKCAHYDPVNGRYSVAVMSVVRALCIAVFAALALWIWRRSRAS